MQTYDFMMLAVLAATTLFGYRKGMAWQIASLASLFVSYFVAQRFSEQLAPTFGNTAPLNRFVAMLVIYVVSSFLIWTLFRFVSGAIDKVKLETFDAQMGALFGAAKGVLLCIVITFFAVTLLPPAQGEAIVNSQSGRYIVALLDKSHSVFPPEIHQIIDPYVNKVEQRLNPNFQPAPGGGLQGIWQSQAQAPAGQQPNWAQLPLLQQIPNVNWQQVQQQLQGELPGQSGAQSAQPQSGLPASIPISWPPQLPSPLPQSVPQPSPYGSPQEPNPFPPSPYSAQAPGGRDF